MTKKLRISFIIEEFWNRGYILYDNEYVGAKTKMKYNCMKHPNEEQEITWSDFKSGRGCKYCANEKIGKSKRKSINEIKGLFESKNLILLSNSYINNKSDLEFICKDHDDEVQITNANKVKQCKTTVCKFCVAEQISERQLGEKSHLWKGGLRSEKQALRETLEYKCWRQAVFKRDNYTCQKCFKSNTNSLRAHHILPFYLYEDLRCDVENGITLCEECHDSKCEGSFHNTYGTHNNTKEQLIDFLSN
jgi:5-methylcytosine-specific restriction endonuclease McrA